MSLNIKNPRVHELAKAAAAATGRSQTSVIEEALMRYLADVTGRNEKAAQDARADAILGELRAAMAPHAAKIRQALDDLYDDTTGLPR